MREVLALGNGISRLLHENLIKSWSGECWGCNNIYREFPDKLTRLFGHRNVMHEAMEKADRRGYGYVVWTGDKELLRTDAKNGVREVSAVGISIRSDYKGR